MAGPSVARVSSSYFPVYRHHDSNLHEFALMRACLGHTCPRVSLERVGQIVDCRVTRDLAPRQRSVTPLAYHVAPRIAVA
eukprot:11703832-Alexandrium_andersonii.AAC.1